MIEIFKITQKHRKKLHVNMITCRITVIKNSYSTILFYVQLAICVYATYVKKCLEVNRMKISTTPIAISTDTFPLLRHSLLSNLLDSIILLFVQLRF